VQTTSTRLSRERADDVIRLHPLDFVNRDSEGAHDVARQGELRAQLGRRGAPGRLVLLHRFVPERDAAQVEGCQYVVRGLLQRQEQHRGEPVGGIDHPAVPIRQRREGEEGPIYEGMAVQEDEPFLLLGFRHQ